MAKQEPLQNYTTGVNLVQIYEELRLKMTKTPNFLGVFWDLLTVFSRPILLEVLSQTQ